MSVERGKIVIIGAGHVGSAILNALLGMNLAKEIVLINLDREQALGEALTAPAALFGWEIIRTAPARRSSSTRRGPRSSPGNRATACSCCRPT